MAGLNRQGGDVLLAGTFGLGVYKSVDDGVSWYQTNLVNAHVFDLVENKGHPHHQHPHPHQGDVFAATATGIFRSTDDGDTWTALTDPAVAGRDVRALAWVDDGSCNGMLFATLWGGGILVSHDGGDTWEDAGRGRIQDNVRAFTTHVSVNDAGEDVLELYAITESGDVYVLKQRVYLDQETTTVDTEDAPGRDVPTAFKLQQNYPNPFNPSTTISFDLPASGKVRLAVYDVLGRQVRLLVDGVLPAGVHDVTFDAADLPSGNYIYRLETGRRTQSRLMTLVK